MLRPRRSRSASSSRCCGRCRARDPRRSQPARRRWTNSARPSGTAIPECSSRRAPHGSTRSTSRAACVSSATTHSRAPTAIRCCRCSVPPTFERSDRSRSSCALPMARGSGPLPRRRAGCGKSRRRRPAAAPGSIPRFRRGSRAASRSTRAIFSPSRRHASTSARRD